MAPEAEIVSTLPAAVLETLATKRGKEQVTDGELEGLHLPFHPVPPGHRLHAGAARRLRGDGGAAAERRGRLPRPRLHLLQGDQPGQARAEPRHQQPGGGAAGAHQARLPQDLAREGRVRGREGVENVKERYEDAKEKFEEQKQDLKGRMGDRREGLTAREAG